MATGASRPKVEERLGKQPKEREEREEPKERREPKESRARKKAVSEAASPELFDATQYDFERLEVVVTDLVEAHRVLQQENAALREQLEGGDIRTRALEAEVEDLQKRRDRSHKRLDLLIADLDRLDAALGDDSTAGAQKKNARPKRKAARGKARSRN